MLYILGWHIEQFISTFFIGFQNRQYLFQYLQHLSPTMSSIDVSVPVTEPDSIWLYNPNFPLSIVFAFVYLIPTAILSYQTIFKYRANFFIVVLVGAVLEVAGYTVRAVACKHLDQIVGDNPLDST
jgi:hypothetical protein